METYILEVVCKIQNMVVLSTREKETDRLKSENFIT